MAKSALCILYDIDNNDLLRANQDFYKNNFENIFHIVPLYSKDDSNIIGVWENKFQKQGCIAQAYRKIKNETFDYYIFIDESIKLNTDINDNNCRDYFNIDDETAYCDDEIFDINKDTFKNTNWAFVSIYNYLSISNGTEASNFLPTKSQARVKYKTFNINTEKIFTDYVYYVINNLFIGQKQTHEFYLPLEWGEKNIKNLTDTFVSATEKEKLITIYPFVASDSKLFVVPKKYMEKFAYYCGIFAAIRQYYKIGLANSLCFAADKIKTKKDIDKETILKV